MKEKNNKKQASVFLNDGFEYKGEKFRPLTARSLVLLERANSPFYFGGSQLQAVMDFLYVSSQDSKTVIKAINDGLFEESVMEYAEKFTTTDLQELGELVSTQNELVASTIVEVRDSGDSDTKKK